jgi:hypothetical protein
VLAGDSPEVTLCERCAFEQLSLSDRGLEYERS